MEIYNVRIDGGIPFEEYLSMPGISYSAVKAMEHGQQIKPTAKMHFGSLVDQFLFEPGKYNGEQYELVRKVALVAKERLGDALRLGAHQLVVACTMRYKGMQLQYKGRVDLYVGGVVIDFKVSQMDLTQAIHHFGYNHQVNGYAIPLQAKTSLILSVSPKAPHLTQMTTIQNSLIFWQQVILKYGKPC